MKTKASDNRHQQQENGHNDRGRTENQWLAISLESTVVCAGNAMAIEEAQRMEARAVGRRQGQRTDVVRGQGGKGRGGAGGTKGRRLTV